MVSAKHCTHIKEGPAKGHHLEALNLQREIAFGTLLKNVCITALSAVRAASHNALVTLHAYIARCGSQPHGLKISATVSHRLRNLLLPLRKKKL